jgi:hypothetical protein
MPEPEPGVLADLISVFNWAIKRAAPVRFTVATSEDERTAIYRQRYDTVIAQGWARPADMPSGLEYDDYDAAALHIGGWDGTTLVASSRLVFPSQGVLLPTERAFGVVIEPHGSVADLGRQIVEPAYNSDQHVIYAGLLGYCGLQAITRSYYYVCGDCTPAMVRVYERLGLHVNVVGAPRLYWGKERLPIVQDVFGQVQTLAERYLKY